MDFIWVSRHPLTDVQRDLAEKELAQLDPGSTANLVFDEGDWDAFGDISSLIEELMDIHGEDVLIGCVHPIIAAKAAEYTGRFACFRNENRAEVGEKPRFETSELRVTYIDS